MSSSRAEGLPANLQGLWNDSNDPAWGSDYHTNINVQMNYWGAEVTGLSEEHIALLNFMEEVAVPSRSATRAMCGPDVPGWTARTSQSPLGGQWVATQYRGKRLVRPPRLRALGLYSR